MEDLSVFETFSATLNAMLVLFSYMLIGFVAKKKDILPDSAATVLSRLENYFFIPAVIINTFVEYCSIVSLSENRNVILYCILTLVLAFAIAMPLSKAFASDLYQRNIYRYALVFGNFSYMGMAIVPAVMGAEALYSYMLYVLPLCFVVYTWGTVILFPIEKWKTFWQKLLNPTVISIGIGIVLGLTGAKSIVPAFLTTTIQNCASCMGPVAMILTGFIIGQYDLRKMINNKRVYIATGLRLLVFPTLYIAVLSLLGADPMILFLTLFAFGTPLGVNTVVFPAAYGGDTSTGASMAMISHTICIFTIPLLYAVLTGLI